MIDVALDIDGVIIAQHLSTNYDSFSNPKHSELIPTSWRHYHKNNIIPLNLNGIVYYFLLTPNALEMLQYLFINLRQYIRVSVFSAGPEDRNRRLVDILKEKVASNAGVNPSSIKCNVFSIGDCTPLPEEHALQPNSNNNPHIPDGSKLWCYGAHYKKILSTVFGKDISNVILIDNSYEVMTRYETDHHLKVPTFDSFSGLDFEKYRGGRTSQNNRRYLSYLFLGEPQFYSGNLACLIAGMMAEIVTCVMELNISASSALKLLQICPETNKYKPAIITNPMYERYNPDACYRGYLILSRIRPIQLFSPYPDFAFETLKLLRDQYNGFIKDALITATQKYWPTYIYHHISQYYGIALENNLLPEFDAASPTITINNGDITSDKLSVTTHPPAIEQPQSNVAYPIAAPITPHLEIKTQPIVVKRRSIYLDGVTLSQQGLFSNNRTTATSLPLQDHRPTPDTPKHEDANAMAKCCVML